MHWEAKKLVTHFTAIFVLLQWSGADPTVSPRYACITDNNAYVISADQVLNCTEQYIKTTLKIIKHSTGATHGT